MGLYVYEIVYVYLINIIYHTFLNFLNSTFATHINESFEVTNRVCVCVCVYISGLNFMGRSRKGEAVSRSDLIPSILRALIIRVEPLGCPPLPAGLTRQKGISLVSETWTAAFR